MAVIPSLRVNGVQVEITASTDYILGTADTSGVRLDVSAGTLRVREGDNTADAPVSALRLSLGGTASANTPLTVEASNDGKTDISVVNSNAGAGAYAQMLVGKDYTTGTGGLQYLGNGFAASGFNNPDQVNVYAGGAASNGLGLNAQANAPIKFATNNTLRAYVAAGGGIGYPTGTGGTVTQLTSKSTGATLNTVTGEIAMNGAALAADTSVSFTLTNSVIAAADLVVVTHHSAGTAGAYTVTGQAAAGSATITVRNVTAGSLSEAIVLKFAVIKGATS